jgi:hypothetical protein
METLQSDLAPVYGAPSAPGMSRETLAEIREFYRSRLAQIEAVKGNCRDCKFLRGVDCGKWKSVVPEEHLDSGCDEWKWDGVPL